MNKTELYENFCALYDAKDFSEHDCGVRTVVDGLFSTLLFSELTEMYGRLKARKDFKDKQTAELAAKKLAELTKTPETFGSLKP